MLKHCESRTQHSEDGFVDPANPLLENVCEPIEKWTFISLGSNLDSLDPLSSYESWEKYPETLLQVR